MFAFSEHVAMCFLLREFVCFVVVFVVCFVQVSCVIPVILMYLECPDIEVLTDTCWALSYLSDGCNEHIQSILDLSSLSNVDISKYLVTFLDKKSMNVLVPALRTCGNIVSGSDHQTQQIIDRGLLTKLKRLLRHPNHVQIQCLSLFVFVSAMM